VALGTDDEHGIVKLLEHQLARRRRGAGVSVSRRNRESARRYATPETANASGVGSSPGTGMAPVTWRRLLTHGAAVPTSSAALCPRNGRASSRTSWRIGTDPISPRR